MSKNIYNSYFKFLAFFKKVDFAAATNLHFMQLLQFQVLYFNYLYVPNTYSFIIELRNWEIVILSPSPKDVKHFIFKCMQDLCNIRSLQIVAHSFLRHVIIKFSKFQICNITPNSKHPSGCVSLNLTHKYKKKYLLQIIHDYIIFILFYI